MSLSQEPSLEQEQKPKAETHPALNAIVGVSPSAEDIRETAMKFANNDEIVLIGGESGTGKDNMAEAIHKIGKEGKPFIKVDCGALSESLAETTLFGHAKGAFTGAEKSSTGRIKAAENGTLLITDIENLSISLQSRFMGFAEDNEFYVVGENLQTTRVKTRIIVTTNINIEEAVKQGKIKHDLYYRLNVIRYDIPSLRERKEDIPFLVGHFLHQKNRSKEITQGAMDVLMNYDWPGNVRELRNAISAAIVWSHESDIIKADHLHTCLKGVEEKKKADVSPGADSVFDLKSRQSLKDIAEKAAEKAQKAAVLERLNANNWDRRKTAKDLDANYKTLRNKLRKWGWNNRNPRPPHRSSNLN